LLALKNVVAVITTLNQNVKKFQAVSGVVIAKKKLTGHSEFIQGSALTLEQTALL